MPEGRTGHDPVGGHDKPQSDAGPVRPLMMPLQHFYRTSASTCPYLPDRRERKLITELGGRDAKSLYHDLCRAGFRRSHHLAYRPSCIDCEACVPVRIPVLRFVNGRSARRIRNLNRDVVGTAIEARSTVEQYRLFSRYQRSRHAESEMAAMSYGDYCAMIEDSPIETTLIEFRTATRTLVGVCLADLLDDGYSAVYSFFDPTEARRSLGTNIVLWLVGAALERGLPYVYLGYWIAASDKMSYKMRFRPLEALAKGDWRTLEP